MSNNFIHGECQCGAVKFAAPNKPVKLYLCHCKECQKQSSSAFGISYLIKSTNLQLINGKPHYFWRKTNSGKRLYCYFCKDCGSRLWHGNRERDPLVSIKGGTLTPPIDISLADHIWTSRKLNGVVIPEGVRCYPNEPDY